MVDPVTTAALVSTGWFANKLLGPSSDFFGEQLKAFFSDRLGKIARRAEEINDGQTTQSLPPAFGYLAVQKAGLSEDDELLTEMWANLLLSASREYRSQHANFAEILARLGPDEVRILNSLVSEDGDYGQCPPVNLKSSIRTSLRHQFKSVYYPSGKSERELAEEARERQTALLNHDLHWPGRITAADYPYACDDAKIANSISGGTNFLPEYDALAGQRLIEVFAFDLSQSFSSPYVEGFIVTGMGISLVQTCRGKK